jgi:DNA-nicking Smr family endonuclease
MDQSPPKQKAPSSMSQKESDIFIEAMADVDPIVFNRTRVKKKPPSPSHAASLCQNEDQDTLAALNMLIRKGHGFIVSQTPEYMESANAGASAEILRRLHQGRYAIQDFIDLHSLRTHEAESVLKRFIQRSIQNSLRTVLIVHGRGLTSPKEPILKKKVFSWLTRGPLRKWVIALTSARTCDGGAGATYVLLRRRPMTKSQRLRTSPKQNT